MVDKKLKNKNVIKGKFINPTNNFEWIVSDDDNITGITTNKDNIESYPLDESNVENVTTNISEERVRQVKELSEDPDEDKKEESLRSEKFEENKEDNVLLESLRENAVGNETINHSTPPHIAGEQSVSGDMPDPGSDDDTLENAQQMGYQIDEDPEHPKPLNMASDFDKGELEHRKK
jgi:hypothetical protein